MVSYRIVQSSAATLDVDLLVLPVAPSDLDGPSPIGGVLPTELLALARTEGFEARGGQSFLLRNVSNLQPPRLLIVGTGDGFDLRQVGVIAARQARRLKTSRVALIVPSTLPGGLEPSIALAHLYEGFGYGLYTFDRYKSSAEAAFKDIGEVLLVTAADLVIDNTPLDAATAIIEGTTLARNLVNEPPATMTPVDIALQAETIASAHGLDYTIFDETMLTENLFNLIMAVGAGSDNPPRLIHLVYAPDAGPDAGPTRRIAIVGKGVTFDTGGYSLKTSEGMMTMHADMAGAAAVLGAAEAIGRLKPQGVEIHFIIPAAENAVSGRAIKPSDIVRGHGGKTVQILNTDAEGRLILADAIAYARSLEPDTIIDLATLTGASVVALGGYTAALFSNDDTLATDLLNSARDAGEDAWRMPLTPKLDKLLDSPVADMKNIGKREGGAITAALFLKRWVGDVSWAHLDIAGPAYFDAPNDYYGAGGSGYGVATLVRYLTRTQPEP